MGGQGVGDDQDIDIASQVEVAAGEGSIEHPCERSKQLPQLLHVIGSEMLGFSPLSSALL
jgi:hypothetical protein